MSSSDVIAGISLLVSFASAFYAWRANVKLDENTRFSSVRSIIMEIFENAINSMMFNGDEAKASSETAGRLWAKLNAECHDYLEYGSPMSNEVLGHLLEDFHEQCVDSALVTIVKGSPEALSRMESMSKSRTELVRGVRKMAEILSK